MIMYGMLQTLLLAFAVLSQGAKGLQIVPGATWTAV
jgi:hypothetical protein